MKSPDTGMLIGGAWIPKWFIDTIPLDPMIAPMVLFLANNGVIMTASCEGGDYKQHLYGRPTINFVATTLNEIERVAELLKAHDLQAGSEVGLMTGFFTERRNYKWFGRIQWVWGNNGETDVYKERVYDRVIKLVDMSEIADITTDPKRWEELGYPNVRSKEWQR